MSVSQLGGSAILSVTDKNQRRGGDVQEMGMNSEHASRICQVTDSYFRLGCLKRGSQGMSRVKLRRTQPGQMFFRCTLLDEVGMSQTCQRPTFTAAAMPDRPVPSLWVFKCVVNESGARPNDQLFSAQLRRGWHDKAGCQVGGLRLSSVFVRT
jgi:hypothetical protein